MSTVAESGPEAELLWHPRRTAMRHVRPMGRSIEVDSASVIGLRFSVRRAPTGTAAAPRHVVLKR